MQCHLQPEVDIEISVNEPLLDEHQLQEGNLVTITVESLFSPPDTWQLSGPQYFYIASLPIPTTSEVDKICFYMHMCQGLWCQSYGSFKLK